MEITELRLQTHNLDAQRAFYTAVLGLPVVSRKGTQTADTLTLQAGGTRLTFEAAPSREAPYHFAFNIPRNRLPQAKQFLAAHALLLGESGREVFHSHRWNADMVYFRDPAGNIAEFVARHTLANDAPGAPDDFGGADILCVSEIGLPVDDIPARVASLVTRFGFAPYEEQSATFAPVGDAHGLFIVVPIGHHWFPTTNAATPAPVTLTMRAPRAGSYHLPGLPYHLTSVPAAPVDAA